MTKSQMGAQEIKSLKGAAAVGGRQGWGLGTWRAQVRVGAPTMPYQGLAQWGTEAVAGKDSG